MRKSLLSLFFTMIFISCSSNRLQKDNSEIFTKELLGLKEYFSIPGLSAIIVENNEIMYENYFGFTDIQNKTKVDSLTAFPIASMTKVFSAILVMKLVEQGKLSLSTPVNQFFTSPQLNDTVQVKHLLSHTSQGQVGKQFYYSSRFGLLTQIIEKASGKSFNELMEDEIFNPLRLQHTFLLKDSLQLAEKNVKMALPYVLENETRRGLIDYGYSTSAGIISTARDLIRFNQALDMNTLIAKASKEEMYSPFQNGLPYGYGIFTQNIKGLKIVWAYGQFDSYSGLLMKVPAKNITLVLLANNNLMSDPARLIMGDAMSSLFAISFLKNFVFGIPEMQLIEKPDSVYKFEFSNDVLYRKKVLAQALAESFMAKFDTTKIKRSASFIEQTFGKYPDYLSYADINLLHNLCFLKILNSYTNLGEFTRFDSQIEKIGEKLLSQTPNNPYLHFYLGTYFDSKGDMERAKFHYQNIVNAKNFSRSWYTVEAENWIKENK